MRIWICIAVHNRVDLTLRCLESLEAQDFREFTVVMCDAGSTDGTSMAVRARFPAVVVIPGDGSLWWTSATNRCVTYVLKRCSPASDFILTLNNDLELLPQYLGSLAAVARRHKNCVVTSVVHDIYTRELVSGGFRLSWMTAKSRPIHPTLDALDGDSSVAEVTHASGRGTLIPVRVFERIGMFDEHRLPHYGSDYDFTCRARRAGFPILVSFVSAVYSHVDQTGLTVVRSRFSVLGLRNYLLNIKSPGNLRARWWFAVNNCPKPLLPSFLLLDFLRVVGSYFRHHLSNAARAK